MITFNNTPRSFDNENASKNAYWHYNSIAEFKAQYYDAFVDRSLLTNFRDTAKELGMKQNAFITWLLDNNFIYRDKKKRIRPYAEFTHFLFEIKDFKSDVNNYAGEHRKARLSSKGCLTAFHSE